METNKQSIRFSFLSTIILILCFFTNSFALGKQPKTKLKKSSLKIESIFPFQNDHVHGSTIVELSNGDVLVSWFQGSGERWADDVKIMGARKKNNQNTWSQPFLLADVKEFPDCNPIIFIDNTNRLWLMWYTVIANQWETSLLKYKISEDYLDMTDAPNWSWQDVLLIKPGDKTERGIQPSDSFVKSLETQLKSYIRNNVNPGDENQKNRWLRRAETIISNAKGQNMVRQGRIFAEDGTYESSPLGYPYFRRMGWQTRNKPFFTKNGRMIVPLYSDGFSFSLMAYTDDCGENWEFSSPLVGGGNIQPTIAQTSKGELVAYMRDNGPPPKRLHVSRSYDEGKNWTLVEDTNIPNPGSACDIVTLKNGNWVLVYNDSESGRNILVVSLSEDEGKTWPWRKIIVSEDPSIKAHYPAIVVGEKDILYLSYSYFLPDGNKTIKYATFNEDWIKTKKD